MLIFEQKQAARLLGGESYRKNQVRCPGPNHSARDRSLLVIFDDAFPEGFWTKSFAGDDFIACRDHVRRMLGWSRVPQCLSFQRPGRVRHWQNDKQRSKLALRLFHEAVPLAGTPADVYLSSRRVLLDTTIM